MKTRLSRTLSCVLGFVAILCFSLALGFGMKKSPVDATELVSTEILDEYYVGQELTMPATVTIAIGENQSVTGSNGILVFPDGTVHNSASYYFELEGEYQAIYYGEYEGKQVKATKTFKVLAENWVVSSSKSTMSYADSMRLSQTAGISVSLAEGDAFVFDQRINIYDLIEEQGERFKVISLTPELWIEGNDMLSCQTISVKLVDYYDPNNFVEFYTWGPTGAIPYKLDGTAYTSTLYSGSGASHQDLTGLEYYAGMSESRLTDKFDGRQGRLHRSTRYTQSQTYGAVTSSASAFVYPHSLHGDYGTESGTKARYQMAYWFNMANGETFFSRYTDKDNRGLTYMSNVMSEYVYPGNTWKGFTTGEVYVQVQCFNYKYGAPINLEITEILGVSGADLNKAYVKDVVDPIVKFETEYTDKNGVYIEKGREITIPTPTVYDINYEGDLDVAVYYNYKSENPIAVYVKDGKFTPDKYGRYTAVYTATDKFGNKTAATYDMNAINEKQFTYEQTKLTELNAATLNEIPTIDFVGINKKPNVKVNVIDPKGGVKDVSNTMSYAPEYIGTYTIQYVIKDNVTDEIFEYTVESVEKGYVLFKDGFKVTEYLIKDAIYDFDDYYVYKATTEGLEPILASIELSIDEGEYASVADLNAYKIEGTKSVGFKAVYNDNFKEIAQSKIVDVGFEATDKDYWAYFQGSYEKTMNPVLDADNNPIPDKFVYAGLGDYISYSFLADTEVKRVDFINPVLLSGFQLDVIVPEGSTYNDYRITLTEFGNSANKMVIRYTTILKGVETLLVIEFSDADGNVLYSKELTSKFDSKHSIFIKDGMFNTTEGVSFNAPTFDDYRTTISVEVISDKDATIGFSKVGNQNFNGRLRRSNEAKPQIHYVRIPGDYTLGSTIQVPKAYAISVLSPILRKDVKVSVTNAEGTESIRFEDGSEMKDLDASVGYEFGLTYLGLFKVTYTYSASVGKGTVRADETAFVINCSDSICPEIQWEEGITENTLITFKAGRTHKLKTFTVRDNETAPDKLFVRVLIFNEYYTLIAYDVMNPATFNGEFTFENAGNYIVQAYCADAAGNYTFSSYSICVLED